MGSTSSETVNASKELWKMGSKDGEDTTISTETSTKEIGRTTWSKAEARWATLMEMSMKGCGWKAKKTVKEFTTITIVLFTKETSAMAKNQDTESSSFPTPLELKLFGSIIISKAREKSFIIMGITIKETSNTQKNRDKEFTNGKMILSTSESSKKTWCLDKPRYNFWIMSTTKEK